MCTSMTKVYFLLSNINVLVLYDHAYCTVEFVFSSERKYLLIMVCNTHSQCDKILEKRVIIIYINILNCIGIAYYGTYIILIISHSNNSKMQYNSKNPDLIKHVTHFRRITSRARTSISNLAHYDT